MGNAHKTKVKKVQSKQKHPLRTKTSPSEPLFLIIDVLMKLISSNPHSLCIKSKKEVLRTKILHDTKISLVNFPLLQTLLKFHSLHYQ